MLEKFLDFILNNFSDVMAFVSAVCSVIYIRPKAKNIGNIRTPKSLISMTILVS